MVKFSFPKRVERRTDWALARGDRGRREAISTGPLSSFFLFQVVNVISSQCRGAFPPAIVRGRPAAGRWWWDVSRRYPGLSLLFSPLIFPFPPQCQRHILQPISKEQDNNCTTTPPFLPRPPSFCPTLEMSRRQWRKGGGGGEPKEASRVCEI